MIDAQKALVIRQTKGYGDNLWIKSAEFEGSLAGFAVNAGADAAGSYVQNATAAANSI